MLNGVGHLLAGTRPELALAVNPLSTEARLGAILSDIENGDEADLMAEARALIRIAPGDARGYSMLGAAYEAEGDPETALSLFRAAIARSQTERFALTRLFDHALAEQDYAGAIAHADLLLRRFRDSWPEIAPLFRQIAHAELGQAELVTLLETDPPWRGSMIGYLLEEPAYVGFIQQMLYASLEQGRAPRQNEVSQVINALIRHGAPGEAYRFFLLTLTEAHQAVSGYVHDSGFRLPPGSKHFEWRFRRVPSADMSFPAEDANGEVGGLRVRFLESPARLGNVTQSLSLPPGSYHLEVEFEAERLGVPRDLYWRLACAEGARAELARIALPDGTHQRRTLSAPLSVPYEGCAVQTLVLDTGVRTDSWRDRYSGTVLFSAVRLVRD